MPGKVLEKIKAQQTADHRMGVPEDIAMIVGFLASEESRWIEDANVPAKWGEVCSCSTRSQAS